MQGNENKVRVRRWASIAGMTLLWILLFDQQLNPARSAPGGLSGLDLLYCVIMFLTAIALAVAPARIRVGLTSNRLLLGGVGAIGVVGAACSCAFGGVGPLAQGVFLALVAICVAFYFVTWSSAVAASESPLLDMAISALVCCLFVGVLEHFVDLPAPTGIVLIAVSAALALWLLSVDFEEISRPEIQSAPSIMPFLWATVAFSFLVAFGIAYYNLATAGSGSPALRYVLYLVDALVLAVLVVVYLAERSKGIAPSAIRLFSGSAILLAVFIIVACYAASQRAAFGVFSLVSARHLLEVLLPLLVISQSFVCEINISKWMAIVFAVGVLLPKICNSAATLLLQSSNAYQEGLLPVAIAAVSSLVVFIITIALLSFFIHLLIKRADIPVQAQTEDERKPVEVARETWGLSNREAEIAELLYQNISPQRIAERLFIEKSTVYAHQKSIYRKADVHSRDELINALEKLG